MGHIKFIVASFLLLAWARQLARKLLATKEPLLADELYLLDGCIRIHLVKSKGSRFFKYLGFSDTKVMEFKVCELSFRLYG